MAIIKPFRGVRYNLDRIPDLSAVVSQPHDRVRHGLQDKYYRLSPYNIARLIKGKEYADDGERDNVFTRAIDSLHSWLQEGVLMREQSPAFYILRQTFGLPDGSVRSRQALVAALELARFDEGIVLPHERTLSKSMSDRYHLLQATATNFGSVFMLYPGNRINELLTRITEKPPIAELHETFENEVLQELWVVTDPDLIAAIAEEMAPKRNLIIADGHHRYETSLKYRDEMQVQYPNAPPNASFNYRLVSLVSMDDPGLEILPTHRLIHSYRPARELDVLEEASKYFEITRAEGPMELERALRAAKESPHPSFGFHNGTSAVLKLRDTGVMDHLLPERTPAWRTLDTAVVHELFIERVLGIDKGAIERQECIEFLRNPQMGYEAVNRGEANFLLLMKPTRVEQVRACSVAGERMPQKSTDFYPKMISGLVALPVGEEERL